MQFLAEIIHGADICQKGIQAIPQTVASLPPFEALDFLLHGFLQLRNRSHPLLRRTERKPYAAAAMQLNLSMLILVQIVQV